MLMEDLSKMTKVSNGLYIPRGKTLSALSGRDLSFLSPKGHANMFLRHPFSDKSPRAFTADKHQWPLDSGLAVIMTGSSISGAPAHRHRVYMHTAGRAPSPQTQGVRHAVQAGGLPAPTACRSSFRSCWSHPAPQESSLTKHTQQSRNTGGSNYGVKRGCATTFNCNRFKHLPILSSLTCIFTLCD